MVPLKYLSNFCKTLEIPLINCEINLILTLSASCFIIDDLVNNQVPTFAITDTKFYVPVVTLSTQDNANLLQQLKSSFRRTINRNKYQSKGTAQEENWYLDYLTDISFQGVNRLLVWSIENNGDWVSYTVYYLLQVEIKEYNVLINVRHNFGWNSKK